MKLIVCFGQGSVHDIDTYYPAFPMIRLQNDKAFHVAFVVVAFPHSPRMLVDNFPCSSQFTLNNRSVIHGSLVTSKMKARKHIWLSFAPTFGWTVLSALCLGLILYITNSKLAMPGMGNGTAQLDASSTLSVLAVLQAIITFTTNSALDQACELLQWKLSADGAGIGPLDFLCLSSTTSWWGIIRIIMYSESKLLNRLWAALK
jgi:hypothetical protein